MRLALPGGDVRGVTFDASYAAGVDAGSFCWGTRRYFLRVAAKVFAVSEGLMPEDAKLNRFFAVATLERRVIGGVCSLLGGVGLLIWAVVRWGAAGLGAAGLCVDDADSDTGVCANGGGGVADDSCRVFSSASWGCGKVSNPSPEVQKSEFDEFAGDMMRR